MNVNASLTSSSDIGLPASIVTVISAAGTLFTALCEFVTPWLPILIALNKLCQMGDLPTPTDKTVLKEFRSLSNGGKPIRSSANLGPE